MNEYWDEIPDQGYIDRLQAENAALLTRLQEAEALITNLREQYINEGSQRWRKTPANFVDRSPVCKAAAAWLAGKEGE